MKRSAPSSDSMAGQVKWGILGSANIAQKVCVAISEASNATVVAVASRDKAKAEAFIEAHSPGARAVSYEDLLDDPEIQVVYIPLPTGMRADWVVKAAEKKKHVLCEKPIATNAADSKRIIDACKANGVQFMDNTMFMHSGRFGAMRKVLDDSELFGVPRHVVSCFTIPLGATDDEFKTGNIRLKKDMEPLGCLGDLGWYCVRFTEWAFGYEKPESVRCDYLESTDEGVPVSLSATLKFSGGRTASFDCSFVHAWRDWAEVVSEKCALRVDDFVIPSKADVCNYTVLQGSCADKGLTFPIDVVKTEDIKEKAQHTLLIEKFSSIVTSGEIEECWPKFSQQTQMLLLALAASASSNGAWVTPE